MDSSDQFPRFAAECEVMAKFTPSPENEAVWHRMAERWIQCAELIERQEFGGSRCCVNEEKSKTRTKFCSLERANCTNFRLVRKPLQRCPALEKMTRRF